MILKCERAIKETEQNAKGKAVSFSHVHSWIELTSIFVNLLFFEKYILKSLEARRWCNATICYKGKKSDNKNTKKGSRRFFV